MTRFIWSLVLVLTLVLALILGITALSHHYITKYEGRKVNAIILENLDSLNQVLLHQKSPDDSLFLSQLRADVISIEEKEYIQRASTFNRRLSGQIDKTFEPVWEHILERQGQSAMEDLGLSAKLLDIYRRSSFQDDVTTRQVIGCGPEMPHDWPSITKIEHAEDCYFRLRSLKRELDFANFSQMIDLAKK